MVTKDESTTTRRWSTKPLNPSAQEFLPSWRRPAALSASAPEFFPCASSPFALALVQQNNFRAHANVHVQQNTGGSERIRRNDGDAKSKRTIYVGDIDPRITEKELQTEFTNCGKVKACRICGDTRSGLRYGFVEFENEECARAAMGLDRTRIGRYPVRVSPSRPARAPFNQIPPQSGDEKEKISRTVYCSFIDKTLTEKDLREFFQSQCGEVSCIRLLSDRESNTRYGFIEFLKEEFAVAAIKCTGMELGNYNVKVVSSKAPIKFGQN